MQPQQQAEDAVVMVCLQAQQVAGLPDAAEGRHIQLSTSPPALAAAVCRAGVADFHRQVLLLHCAPISSIHAVAVTVSMGMGMPATCSHLQHTAGIIASVNVDLAEQLRRRPCPSSPIVLTFELGGTTASATAGAVLSLTLHHRLTVTSARTGCCCCLGLPLAAGCCPPVLRTTTKQSRQRHQGPAQPASSASSSGFITIEKGTISGRRPPSDHLLTTDDDEVDDKGQPTTSCWSLDLLDGDDTKVENEFLAMLMLQDDADGDGDGDLMLLDALIKEAEADLAAIWPSRG